MIRDLVTDKIKWSYPYNYPNVRDALFICVVTQLLFFPHSLTRSRFSVLLLLIMIMIINTLISAFTHSRIIINIK